MRSRQPAKRWGLVWLTSCLLLGALFLWKATPGASAPDDPAVIVAANRSLPTKSIEDIRVGERVMANNPLPGDADPDQADPDPATWRQLTVSMINAHGKRLDIVMLRPLEWIDALDAAPGESFYLDMPEMDATGDATIVSIDRCPPIEPGPHGEVVTATFAHEPEDVLVNVALEGIAEPISCTSYHRFWSEDRRNYVEAGELRPGERVRARRAGLLAVTSVTHRPVAPLVYNLEVNREHVYEVSELGVLVHNSYSISGRIKAAGLPKRGRIRYVPPKNYNPNQALPRGRQNGYIDRFGNEWVSGPSRTRGEPFEWDVQLSEKGRKQLGWLTRDGTHCNVSLSGKVTHK